MSAFLQSNLPGVPVRRGKVRDVYDLGDTLLLVGFWTDLKRIQTERADMVVLSMPAELEEILPAAGKAPQALAALALVISGLHPSTFQETDPVDVGDQPRFLNAAAIGYTLLSPEALLTTLLEIERRFGRERPYPGAPRTADLPLQGGERLYEALREGKHVLVGPALPGYADRLHVVAPAAPSSRAVLVRPDGYLAWQGPAAEFPSVAGRFLS